MAKSGSDDTTPHGDPQLGRQDPLVERLRPDAAAPPPQVLVLVGLLGNSDRPGHKRLYFSTAMDFYAEIRIEDIVHRAAIEAAHPPFVGHEASRLTIKRSAVIHYVRSVLATALDDFDIDIQVSPGGGSGIHTLTYTVGNCGGTGGGCPGTLGCPNPTEPVTQCGMTCQTCNTCQTRCNAYTCQTCNTQCNQGTCHTCNQQTCQTCNTQCNQATCYTCHTCQTQCSVECALNNPTSPAHCIPTPGPTRVPCLTDNCG
jgi:hypothetical protein